MKKKTFILIAIAASLCSCIYEYEPELRDEGGRIVIEGDICLGEVCSFRAGRVVSFDADSFSGFNVYSAEFIVQDDHDDLYVGKNTIDLTNAPTDRKYRLIANVQAEPEADWVQYVTPWMSPEPAPEIGELGEKFVDRDGDGNDDELSLRLNLAAENSSGCYRWDYEELYYYRSLLPAPELEYMGGGVLLDHTGREGGGAGGPVEGGDLNPGWWKYSYCWRQTHSYRTGVAIAKALKGWELHEHEFLSLNKMAPQLQQGEYYIRLSAKSIPEDEYRYLDAVNRGSESMGSLLSPLPSEVRGNLHNSADSTDYAVGYVGVNCVARKILKVKSRGTGTRVIEANYYRNPLDPPVLEGGSVTDNYIFAYENLELLPYKNIDGVNIWVAAYCLDCRLSGGTLEKPSGWEID